MWEIALQDHDLSGLASYGHYTITYMVVIAVLVTCMGVIRLSLGQDGDDNHRNEIFHIEQKQNFLWIMGIGKLLLADRV